MSRRLSPDRSSSAPVLSLRLPAELSSALENELVHLRDLIAATPDLASLAPDRSDLARVLLGEALAARRAAREAKLSSELGNLTLHAPSLGAVAATFSPPPEQSVRSSSERPCDRCGEGVWHGCDKGCGRRTRTCKCNEATAEGACETCAKGSAIDPVHAPPKARTVKRIAPDGVQESAREAVRAWLARDVARLPRDLVSIAGTADQNLRRWLNPNKRQRLPTDTIAAILAHVRANP